MKWGSASGKEARFPSNIMLARKRAGKTTSPYLSISRCQPNGLAGLVAAKAKDPRGPGSPLGYMTWQAGWIEKRKGLKKINSLHFNQCGATTTAVGCFYGMQMLKVWIEAGSMVPILSLFTSRPANGSMARQGKVRHNNNNKLFLIIPGSRGEPRHCLL